MGKVINLHPKIEDCMTADEVVDLFREGFTMLNNLSPIKKIVTICFNEEGERAVLFTNDVSPSNLVEASITLQSYVIEAIKSSNNKEEK